LVLYLKDIDPIVFSCCCSTAREMTGQCENNASNQMLPETNIDKSPYTYVKKLQKELYFIDLFRKILILMKNTLNFHYKKLIECIYGQERIF
jgi:hypothetical protein